MTRQLFHFVAGEQHVQFTSRNHLDAFLAFSIAANRKPFAAEFRELPIEVYDQEGNFIGTKSWGAWKNDVLRDTYGADFEAKLEESARLL